MDRFSQSLDRYITGNYGEDQFKNDCPCEDCKYREEDGGEYYCTLSTYAHTMPCNPDNCTLES